MSLVVAVVARVISSSIALTALLAVVALAALLVGPRALGVQPLIVLTGSMEPTLPTGGLAFMRPLADPAVLEGATPYVDPAWEPTSAIRAGDIITFRMARDPRQTISHRVLAVIEDERGRRFETKGDASPRADAQPVTADQVVGTVIFSVPRLGYVADWLRHGESFVILVGAPTLLVVVGESVKIVRDVRRARAARRESPSADRHTSRFPGVTQS